MQPISMLDAISPAVRHTKALLQRPIPMGRKWKLGMTAYLGMASVIILPLPVFGVFLLPLVHGLGSPTATWLFAGAMTLGSLLLMWLQYLCTGLQFAAFDEVLAGEVFVRPSWHRHHAAFRNLYWLKFSIGIVMSLALGVPVFLAARPMMTTFPTMLPANFVIVWACMFFGILGMWVIGNAVSDLLLPPMALEGLSLSAAWMRVREMIRRERALVLWVVLKNVLAIVGLYAAIFAVEIALIIVLLLVALVGAIVGAILHVFGAPKEVMIALGVPVGLVLYVGFGWAMSFAVGIYAQFREAWNLFFLAGRYPPLGDAFVRREPSPPVGPSRTNWPLPYVPPPPDWPGKQ